MKKQTAFKWCSKYIRLRDSIEYCKRVGITIDSGVAECCTCGKVLSIESLHAGHWRSRGLGGGSGIYFDERGIHAQCCTCNTFEGGRVQEYTEFMLEKYGQDVMHELLRKDKTHLVMAVEIPAIAEMYKQMYEELKSLI